MATMYSLPAYMSTEADPVPVGVMYGLPNYHKSATNSRQNGNANGGFAIVDPVQLVEKKQLELIASLTSLGDKLNALLKQKGTSKSNSNDKSTSKTTPKVVEPVKNEAEGKTKDKDAKKEARKAAKQEAKAKVASGDQVAPVKGKSTKENGLPWTVKENKKSTETGQSLTACLRPELADFAKQDLGDVKLTISNADLPWVTALAKIGDRQGVAFTGTVTNTVGKGKTLITVELGENFSFALKEASIKSRVTAWEVLGSALGLYSFDSTQAIQAAHQRQWLTQADRVIRKEVGLTVVTREMSQFLSRFDTLGSQFNVGVADFIFRSLLTNSAQSNNVELWINRVDSV